jgi:hypothetical protein
VDYLFTDYSKGLEILDNLENCACSVEMSKAIQKLQSDYNEKWKGILRSTADMSEDALVKVTDKKLKEWIKEKAGDSSVLFSVLDIADIEKPVDAAHKLLALRKIECDLQREYAEAIETVRSGNYTEDDLKKVDNLFNLLKETTKDIYTTYKEMCIDDPDKQVYINQQLDRLSHLRMGNSHAYRYRAP